MTSQTGKRSDPLKFAAGFAVIFGILTVLSGSIALFSSEGIRERFGDVVQFVLWFNFVSGFAYVLTGAGLWRRKRWAVIASVLLFLAILGVFTYLGLHIASGAAFETRTVVAMTFRASCWLIISLIAIRQIVRRAKPE
ncbi:MAG: hypothetical protein K5905_13310 [Roseibium sp.]|uniref:hypothetical protein n=1 Tax=Roseibium sp. TaxID=1936156 RepID=UPI00261AD325|nr:hypothetical protein [Roseibium sp.]MCV0426446.1 hypothetical protein [Roseibium sp.]